jgi:hypothetical protein
MVVAALALAQQQEILVTGAQVRHRPQPGGTLAPGPLEQATALRAMARQVVDLVM